MSKPAHKRFVLFTAFKKKYRFIVYNGPALGFALLIFVMSSVPGYKLPDIGFDFGDKIVHSLEFGLFGIFLYRAFRYSLTFSRPYLLTLFVGLPYAALDEIHQLFVPGRFSTIGDFTADAVGIIIFAGISAWMNPLKKSISKQPEIPDAS